MDDEKLDFDLEKIEFELREAEWFLTRASVRLNNHPEGDYKIARLASEMLNSSEYRLLRKCIYQRNTQTDNDKEL